VSESLVDDESSLSESRCELAVGSISLLVPLTTVGPQVASVVVPDDTCALCTDEYAVMGISTSTCDNGDEDDDEDELVSAREHSLPFDNH
jgi:hypothetical protein